MIYWAKYFHPFALVSSRIYYASIFTAISEKRAVQCYLINLVDNFHYAMVCLQLRRLFGGGQGLDLDP